MFAAQVWTTCWRLIASLTEYQTCYKVVQTALTQTCCNKIVTKLTTQDCNNIVISRLHQSCRNNLVTSLTVPSSLLQVVKSLFQTWNKQGEQNLSAACEQTCCTTFVQIFADNILYFTQEIPSISHKKFLITYIVVCFKIKGIQL